LVDYVSISPLAKGLFQRTIAESHVRYYKDPELFALPTQWATRADAEAEGVRFEQATGAKSLADMRQIPWEKLLELAKSIQLDVALAGDHLHVVDGYAEPYNNGDTFKKGAQNNVFYMAGDNKDESGAQPDTAFDIITGGKRATVNYVATTKLADYVGHARDKFGAFTDRYLKLYPASTDREAFLQSSAATRDSARVSTWMWAQLWTRKATHPVFIYMWTHAPPGPNHDLSGASHGSEIAYVYGRPSPQWTDDDKRISDVMMSYWVNYAATGNPNGKGLPRWPAFSAKRAEIMELGDGFAPAPLASKAKIAFWKAFFAAQSGDRPPKGAYQARAVRE
jgi:para-nitrobenzyl esterase